MKRSLKCCEKKCGSHSLINNTLHFVMSFIFIIVIWGAYQHTAHAQTDNAASNVSIKAGDEWSYFKGLQKPPRQWTRSDFDISNWQKGPSGFGYGNAGNRTNLSDMRGNYSTVYARRVFTVDNVYTITGMTLSVVCDGPFRAYLNDIEIIRNNSINKNQSAEQLNVSGFIHELLPGENVLSVECSNDDINSNDFSFIPIFEILEHQGGAIQ